jgi:glucose-6-phosphate 1-dehydrogenase
MMRPMLIAPSPFSFILFGASGNLAKLKIYPSLYTLALKKRLPEHYSIVGYARSPMTDEQFRAFVRESVITDMIEVNEHVLDEFLSHVSYHRGQYDKTEDYAALKTKLDDIEKGWKKPVRMAYFSVPPHVFTSVLDGLCAGKVHEKGGRFRCIVEKPVGHDLKSFEEIRAALMECFGEDEIYLLDHYLGKEAVRNVYYLRFANPVLERLLKNTLIHHVEITATEAMGLEGRAGYFEQSGTLQDMFQSHLVLIASLLTMRLAEDAASFRAVRLNALEQFYLPPAADLGEVVLQGQYGKGVVNGQPASGYLEEEGVAPGSRTNTFVALKLLSRISRWQGVPFYLKSGKRLQRKETRISIEFMEPHPVGDGETKNRLDIILQGEAGMRLHLQTKIGGLEPKFRPLVMEDPLVCVGDCLPEHGNLLMEAIHGFKQWYLTFDEIRTAWRLIDPVQAHLRNASTPLHAYPAGSNGPDAADEWIARDGLKWF